MNNRDKELKEAVNKLTQDFQDYAFFIAIGKKDNEVMFVHTEDMCPICIIESAIDWIEENDINHIGPTTEVKH